MNKFKQRGEQSVHPKLSNIDEKLRKAHKKKIPCIYKLK